MRRYYNNKENTRKGSPWLSKSPWARRLPIAAALTLRSLTLALFLPVIASCLLYLCSASALFLGLLPAVQLERSQNVVFAKISAQVAEMTQLGAFRAP